MTIWTTNAWQDRPYNKNNYNNIIYLICPEDILLYILHSEVYYYVHCKRVLEYRLKRNNLRQSTSIKYKLYYYDTCEYNITQVSIMLQFRHTITGKPSACPV